MGLNYNTTWIGFLGGGASGSIIGGGSIYQIDVWNMGGNPLPARVLVKGKRLGAMAEAGVAHAILIVTGCRTAEEMDGIESSGVDWELAVGLKGSALAKTGAKLFRTVTAQVTAQVGNWAVHESAKRLAQWAMDDLGVIKPGRQFNLLPSPLAFSVGAGIFYEWQKLQLLSGKIGWDHISPNWYVEKVGDTIRLQMFNIPEQDGERVRVGFSIREWGLDPFIRWKKNKGAVRFKDYHIEGYAFGGFLFEKSSGMGYSGINLSNLEPVGQIHTGWLSTSRNDEMKRGGKLRVRPTVFQFSNVAYWKAQNTVEMLLDAKGRFIGTTNGRAVKS